MTSQPFEQHVDRYDEWFERNRAVYESELRAVASLLPRHGVGIEIGVGTGRFAARLGIAVGAEPSAAMSAVARRRGIEVIQAVAECLPLADATFDVALLVTTLCFLDDAPLAFRETHRVLKQNGSLVVGFVDRDSPLGHKYQARKAQSVFYRQARFYNVAEVVDLMESTGFQDLVWVQTLFQDPATLRTPDPVCPGHGQGSFVVVRGTKTLSIST
jgi:SAM-dependent methyltransferase